jgi:hypothetical protein
VPVTAYFYTELPTPRRIPYTEPTGKHSNVSPKQLRPRAGLLTTGLGMRVMPLAAAGSGTLPFTGPAADTATHYRRNTLQASLHSNHPQTRSILSAPERFSSRHLQPSIFSASTKRRFNLDTGSRSVQLLSPTCTLHESQYMTCRERLQQARALSSWSIEASPHGPQATDAATNSASPRQVVAHLGLTEHGHPAVEPVVSLLVLSLLRYQQLVPSSLHHAARGIAAAARHHTDGSQCIASRGDHAWCCRNKIMKRDGCCTVRGEAPAMPAPFNGALVSSCRPPWAPARPPIGASVPRRPEVSPECFLPEMPGCSRAHPRRRSIPGRDAVPPAADLPLKWRSSPERQQPSKGLFITI